MVNDVNQIGAQSFQTFDSTKLQENINTNKSNADAYNMQLFASASAEIETEKKSVIEFVKNNAPEKAIDEIIEIFHHRNEFIDNLRFVNDEELVSYIKSLSYFELLDTRTFSSSELFRWNSTYKIIDCINKMQVTDDNINKEVLKSNVLSDNKFTIDHTKFMNMYPDISKYYKLIIDTSTKAMDEMTENVDPTSTKFVTREMIKLLEKKISALDPNELNYQRNTKLADKMISMFNNRTDTSYLKAKIENYFIANRKEIKKEFKDYMKGMSSNKTPDCIKVLLNTFGESTLFSFWYATAYYFHCNIDAMFLFFNYLAKILKTKKTNIDSTWVKLYVLNINDCMCNKFDIDYPSKQYAHTLKSFYSTCNEFLHREHLSLNVKYVDLNKILFTIKIDENIFEPDKIKEALNASNQSEYITELYLLKKEI